MADRKGFPKDSGHRGIWYYNEPTRDEYRYKYSGGLATYPQQLMPMACYAPQAGRRAWCRGRRYCWTSGPTMRTTTPR